MLHYLHSRDLKYYPDLRDSMFRDRATQFRDRLGWPVNVDSEGQEKDQYDELDPIYVIWQDSDGLHGGSARFLPTTGRTMVNEHFLYLVNGVPFNDPTMWECTRFCLAPKSNHRVASALMFGGGVLMRANGLTHFVGVFSMPMLRVYRLIGAEPTVVGSDGNIGVGVWEYSDKQREVLLKRAGIVT